MSEQARKEATEKFNRMIAKAQAERQLADNPAFQRDFVAAHTDKTNADGAAAVEAEVRNAPASPKATIEANHAERMVSLDQWEAMCLVAAERQAVAEVELDGLKRQIKDLKSDESRAMSAMQFDVSGKLKSGWSRDAEERLLNTTSSDERVRNFQAIADQALALQDFIDFSRRLNNDPNRRKDSEFNLRAGVKDATIITDIKQTRTFKEYMAQKRAMYSTSAGGGDEFVPTGYSAQVYELYQMQRQVMGKIPRIQMPTQPWVLPCTTALPTFYLSAEKTADDSTNAKASKPTTSSQTLTAVKFMCRIVWSNELNEDSIVAMLPFQNSQVGKAWAGCEENVGINGDTTATHFDTGYTVASDDERRGYKGFRRIAIDNSATVDLSTFSDANVLAGIAKMGERASNLKEVILIPSPLAFLKYIVGSPTFATWEKVGSLMTPSNMSGTVGLCYGMMVAPSGKLAANLDNTGIYSAAGQTYTGMLAVHTDAYLVGERRGFQSRVVEDIETDQLKQVTSCRQVMLKRAGSTEVSEVWFYKIS